MNGYQKDSMTYQTHQDRGDKETMNKELIDKLRYDLISPIALEELVKVYTFGSKKYSPRNWEKGIPFSEMFAALMRHAWAWIKRSDQDPESGLHPLAHVAFWCFAIIHLSYTRPTFDDRK